ncbi:recombinase RecT [Paenisporosarcina sp. OV554]|uniref:recombinase RecT n=1 Tax=Paenisporosarcina sp. OV554 TaxID=2135694 RepID=UPI000D396226|nr:recombinase RecT [Paenisporosarcina sp. OV554]PUB12592.1 recombination protein RecT [Paenisporosarcina sp. OV554]
MSNQNQLAMIKKDTVDIVANKVKQFQESGELHFPANYSPENAMKSAWLLLQDVKDKSNTPALQACSKDSIANSLLDMVVQGLNPAKKQGYFIAYGKTLSFQRSYFGTMAVTLRTTGAKSIDAAVIYEGDDVDYEMMNGRVTDLKHKQKFGNQDKPIIGAYCTIIEKDGSIYIELMTIAEIEKAWGQSKMNPKGESSTHKKFPQEMAKRTVINRACKKLLNASDDNSLVMKHIHASDEAFEEAQLAEEIQGNANQEIIDVEGVEVVEETGEILGGENPPEQKEETTEPADNNGPGW